MTAFPRAMPAAPVAVEKLRLSDLKPGRVATVHEVEAPGDDAVRLKALGICVGRRVQLMQCGDPLIVRVLGTRVGMARRLAGSVWVETPV